MQKVAIETRKPTDTAFDAQRKVIDWSDSSDRKWLMNHLHHCMMNAKNVSLFPLNRII